MNMKYVKIITLALTLNSVMSSFISANEQTENAAVLANKVELETIQATAQPVATQEVINVDAKSILMTKLANLAHFSANFNQEVHSESGEVLGKSSGKLAISKPNLANWHTDEPDELLIISDGEDVWFYNPWIEQVSVYSLSAAIAQTPILLLTSKDETLWQNYSVAQQTIIKTAENKRNDISLEDEIFVITAKEANSQIKSLTLYFDSSEENAKLTQFSFLDATGQLSHIKLSDFDDYSTPDQRLFKFSVPEGVQIDDQRAN